MKPASPSPEGEETSGINAATVDPAIFNRATYLERLMDDEELARTIIKSYLEDLPGQIKQLQDYVIALDLPQIRRQAHLIKGGAANLSADALYKHSAALELAGKDGDPARMAVLMAELEHHFEALARVLRQEIARPEQTGSHTK
jgi:HPt (histidine-containing phosphotransfer) domain-containing protein